MEKGKGRKSIVIIGNGAAGITAARHIRKRSDHRITVISSETDHFFSRTALMYIYMGHMKYEHTKPYEDGFWKKNRIDLVRARVEKIEPGNNLLFLESGVRIEYDELILATGSLSNKLGWPGQHLKGVQGLYSYQDLEQMEADTKNIQRAVVVGGGLIGIEMVEMLTSRHIPVTYLVRSKSFWNSVLPEEESAMVNRHIRSHHVDLRLGTELKEILPDGQGRASAVVTTDGQKISAQFVGLAAGVHPNIGFLEGSGIETSTGILVDGFLRTNIPNIYALGDCARLRQPSKNRKPTEAIWYTAKMMGETVAATICGSPARYDPGIWFNSAKFFDIEWQIYGTVPARPTETEASIYWESKKDDRSLRIVYDRKSMAVVGFNALGIRLRHEVCDTWIREQVSLDTVLSTLQTADFDSEFSLKYGQEISSMRKNVVL